MHKDLVLPLLLPKGDRLYKPQLLSPLGGDKGEEKALIKTAPLC